LVLNIRQALQDFNEQNQVIEPVTIEFPQDGAVVKTPSVRVEGFIYGAPFCETFKLVPGENNYTKSVTDQNGGIVSKSVKIYLQNQPGSKSH